MQADYGDDVNVRNKKAAQPTEEAADDEGGAGAPQVGPHRTGAAKALSGLSTWQALVLWVLVVALFLTVVPRIFKLRRRQRSGMRTE